MNLTSIFPLASIAEDHWPFTLLVAFLGHRIYAAINERKKPVLANVGGPR